MNLSRLVLKHGSMPEFVAKDDGLVVKSIREDVREIDFIASTERKDSHDDIIDQASWDLEDYSTNPIVLYGHDSHELPIGKSTYVAVKNGVLECTIRFSEVTQKAKEVWALLKEQTLRAVSVGFRPVDGGYEMRDGDEVWVWRRSKLKEISVVPIGANPDALAKMEASVLAIKSAYRETNPRSGAPNLTTTTTTEKTGAPGKGQSIMKTAEQLQQELNDKTAAHEALASKHTSLSVKLVEVEARAEKAEAKITVSEKALESANSEIAALKSTAKTLEAEHTKACTDRDANAAKAKESEDKLVELEVDAIVGKKIAPSEKEEFVELRKKDQGLFVKMVAKRPDMKLEDRVTQTEAEAAKKGDSAIHAPVVPGGPEATTGAISAFNSLGD